MDIVRTFRASNQLLWSLIGLFLTIGGTFVEAYFTTSPWGWGQHGIKTYSLGVSYQVGAVLLISCLGGKNAGALSQIAYLVLGLTRLPVFAQCSGVICLGQPYFGYLIGFVFGAWVCGLLAFRTPPRLEYLTFSCAFGLLTIHITGLVYLILLYTFGWAGAAAMSLQQAVLNYSLYPLPGQIIIVCAVTVLAYGLRYILFIK
ncbi:MAG: biotin transporter BioY [Chroococcidiopsidaceae cyanobacterium CP_BM_ER_R8_30]|nr:biotin transporter BioY [Chroococcidiopsidaceae cyanobacterium CP_BM_ER_R8_30]